MYVGAILQHSGGIPVTIKKAAALLLAAAVAFSFTACHMGKAKNAGKTIHYHLAADPATLDPQIASDTPSLIVIRSLFEGLTRLDANENPQPGVAKSWESNADSTQFTFHLRADTKWSDKKYGPVTAADFVFAFQRALDPGTGSTVCLQMYCMKNAKEIHSGKLPADRLGATASDAKTLVVSLAYSCPDFPKIAASAVFMPCNRQFFTDTAGRYGLDTPDILENGPFCIDGAYGWTHGKSLKLARLSSYAGQSQPLPGAVNFSIGGSAASLSDPAAALAKLSTDAVQIPASQTDAARSLGCTIASIQDTTWGLGFNTQSPLFKNEKVRRAFVQAFSRSAVLSHLPKDTAAADSVILPKTTLDGQDYRKLAGGPFLLKQSPSAPQLLTQGLRELGVDEMNSVAVLCPDDASVKLMVNEMIASWNREFDNYFNITPVGVATLESRIQSGSYSVAVYPVTPSSDGPYASLSTFLGTSSANPAGLKDAAYDALVSSGQAKSGSAAAASYAAAEKYLSDRAIFYPLYYGKTYYAVAKGVTGIIFHPYGGGVDFINAGKE